MIVFIAIVYLVVWFYVVSSDDGGASYSNIYTDVSISEEMLCGHKFTHTHTHTHMFRDIPDKNLHLVPIRKHTHTHTHTYTHTHTCCFLYKVSQYICQLVDLLTNLHLRTKWEDMNTLTISLLLFNPTFTRTSAVFQCETPSPVPLWPFWQWRRWSRWRAFSASLV